MRLIDVKTFQLAEFFDPKIIPRYAILSHAWTDQEVNFQEWEQLYPGNNANHTDHINASKVITSKFGYAKIVGACRRAAADGLPYLWCDTNCIDKRSSAELTEAINSMYAWYQDSEVCYAYLNDVESHPQSGAFAQSRWFTRGWTLQELLAPTSVIFFSKDWRVLGSRKDLATMISEITRIHIGALVDRETVQEYSIAQRMSWAADRETTREEDIAYCLLGIFDINMPLLYGEGMKAFARLQQEIIKVSDDQSILAWELQDTSAPRWTSTLAFSPAEFRFCGSIVRDMEMKRGSYAITNLGISMNLPVIKTMVGGIVLVGLNCARELRSKIARGSRHPNYIDFSRHFQVWIYLRHINQTPYLRGHFPCSSVFLGQSYPLFSRPTPTDLFLTVKVPTSIAPRRTQHALELRTDKALSYSGFLVTFASGKMMPHGHTFHEVYPPEELANMPLKERRSLTLSHQLISNGNFTVILSILWDRNEQPQEHLHTVLWDPKMQTTREMATQDEWVCLFQGDSRLHPAKCCDTVSALKSLHKRLQQAHEISGKNYTNEEIYPLVHWDTRPFQDLHSRAEVLVEVIFREPPRFL
ncbi:HET-domain-containing protein [Xylariaceae sp. FL0662B]|nr:HET-domain-containing protein [Xylariaceae sp. FL0662B]